jgi:hypothetical protein
MSGKYSIVAVILLLAAAAVAVGFLKTTDPGKAAAADLRGQDEVHIVLTDKGWEPSKVLISEGTTVVFSSQRPYPYWPASNEHPSHSIYPEFDPKEPVMASSTWSFRPKQGVWGFHDHIRSYYSGVLYVE